MACLLGMVISSPILSTEEEKAEQGQRLISNQQRTDWCPLPPDMGRVGSIRFIEDCGSLQYYQDLLPRPSFKRIGIHSLVCCPDERDSESLCFPSDPHCPTFVPQDYDSLREKQRKEYEDQMAENDFDDFQDDGEASELDYDYGYYEYDPTSNKNLIDRQCANITESCVSIGKCSIFSGNKEFPSSFTSPCGFDTESAQLLVCCPSNEILPAEIDLLQPPNYPEANGEPRECEDRHKLCGQWAKLGGCTLESEHILSKLDKKAPVAKVSNKEMFDFMQVTCPRTCGWCGDKGCVDEHPQCGEWTYQLLCHEQASFMSHTCRESCGVCGFLSAYNIEEQVVDGLSYTDINSPTFDCGRDLPRCEREGFSCDEPEPSLCLTQGIIGEKLQPSVVAADEDYELPEPFILRNADEETGVEEVITIGDVFFSAQDSEGGSCSSIPINDRWALGAAHCYQQYTSEQYDRIQQIELQNPGNQSSEFVEVRKIFNHPLYIVNNSYNDIALLELGRRLIYNFEKDGLTPDCLDNGLDLTNYPATVSGFGLTPCAPDEEPNAFGMIREMNVTLLSNEVCVQDIKTANLSSIWQNTVNTALPAGIPESMVCAKGSRNNLDVYSGACEGDSGGPMKVFDPENRLTLVGLVSGGLRCGIGEPGWNTKISYHRQWIDCIMSRYLLYKQNYAKTEQYCKRELQRGNFQVNEDNENLIFQK